MTKIAMKHRNYRISEKKDSWVGGLVGFGGAEHCKLLQLINKLQGKAVTHSEKLEWWIILMMDCVTILLYTSVKWLHIPPLK